MLQKGSVVRSAAGHDKDRFYIILSEQGGRVVIADGKARKLAKPKSKNIRHVRPTAAVLDLKAVTTDKKLREALKPFNSAASEKGGC